MSTIGIFPQFTAKQTTTVKVTEQAKAEGGIVAFEVVNTNGGRLLAGAGAQGAGESLDIHVTDNGGTNLFNIKRGVLDQGFRGEDPYKKSDLFKIHKKHFTTKAILEAHYQGESGSDTLEYNYDTAQITHKGQSIGRIVQRAGKQVQYAASDEYILEIGQDVDVSLIVAICVVADQHMLDRRNEGYTEP